MRLRSDGANVSSVRSFADHPELKVRFYLTLSSVFRVAHSRSPSQVETTTADTAEEADVTRTPPDPRYPSGVLSVVIHQINSLERQNLKGATGTDREGVAGQDTDEPSEQGDNLPSAYCEMVLNDDLIYKTRVKQ